MAKLGIRSNKESQRGDRRGGAMGARMDVMIELLAICGFDAEVLTMEMPHFLFFGCKGKKMFYYDWDEEETFEEVKLSMQLDIDDTLVDLVLDEEASFFVYSSDLDVLRIAKEMLVGSISALLGGHLEAQEYVDNMAVRGRYDEFSVCSPGLLGL